MSNCSTRTLLARLQIRPSFGQNPLPVYSISLVEFGARFSLEVIVQCGRARRVQRLEVASDEVVAWLARLKTASLPALPVSSLICDGAYQELEIQGEGAALTLGWWGNVPAGAEVLGDFADWISDRASLFAEPEGVE